MFRFRRVTNVEGGTFSLGTEVDGRLIVDPVDLWTLAKDKRVKVLVPIDKSVSPWQVPKLFALSPHQALTLMEALSRAPPERQAQVTWMLRSDASVALVSSEIARGHHDDPPCLPAC